MGDGFIAVSYVPKSWQQLTTTDLKTLSTFGFRIRQVSTVNATINQVRRFAVRQRRLRRRELEVQQFVACRAVLADSTFDSGLLTIKEKRTLNHLSDQCNPKQEQQHQPQPTSHTSNDARHHPNILTSRHTAYAKHVEVGVVDPVLPPVFGDSEKDSGLKVEGGVPSLPESSDATCLSRGT